MIKMTGLKIELDNQEITAETQYEEVEGTLENGKRFIVRRWRSFDDNIGITDEGHEFLDDGDNLNEGEKQQIEDYLSELAFK